MDVRNLNSPMTSMVAGRGGSQVTFLIHTSIIQPHQSLHKLCKQTTGGPSNKDASTEQSPTTQIVLKDYDSQIVSSLLSFLYTNEYWPVMPLLLSGHDESLNSQHTFSQSKPRLSCNLFTAHAITSHHFKLAMLASKFSIGALLLVCRRKINTILMELLPAELLNLVRTLYSKDYSYREQFFELINCDEGQGSGKESGPRSVGWSGVSFWSKDVLEKLMTQESQLVGSDISLGSMHENEVGEIFATRDEFLSMVAGQGGELASDVVKAFWEAEIGRKLATASMPDTTRNSSGLTLARERGDVMDVDGT